MLKIAVFGTESTGKTALAQDLAAAYDCPWSAEYVRDFWETQGGDIRGEHLGRIAGGQLENMARACRSARDLVICDTELLTNTLWADLLFPGQCPAWVYEAAECQRFALYLLCEADTDWASDPQRSFPAADERAAVAARFKTRLIASGQAFVVLKGSRAARLAAARQAIDGLLAGPSQTDTAATTSAS